MADDLRQRSRTLYDGPNRAPARSYLKAIGLTDRDIARPIVGIANTWTGTCTSLGSSRHGSTITPPWMRRVASVIAMA